MAKIIYGVFTVSRNWKVYAEGHETHTFEDRQSAVASAIDRTRASLASGDEADLYVQQPSGELAKIDRALLGH